MRIMYWMGISTVVTMGVLLGLVFLAQAEWVCDEMTPGYCELGGMLYIAPGAVYGEVEVPPATGVVYVAVSCVEPPEIGWATALAGGVLSVTTEWPVAWPQVWRVRCSHE